MNKNLIILSLAALLTACGGSQGQNESTTNAEVESGVTYGTLYSKNYQIRLDSARTKQEEGNTQNLPTSGAASYAGFASFSENASPQIIANANLSVNFKDSSISGQLNNFRGDDGTVFKGQMLLSNGAINNSKSSITADIDGKLTSDSARMSTVDATGEFSGNFIGDNHQYIRGDTSAIWITNAGMNTEERISMQGELTAEKQY